MKLSALNPSKVHGPDGIPAWLLKENADLLAGPVSAILNSSFHESLEYASPVFHRSLSNYISEDLERIQRRAFRIIYPDLSYSVALETVGLPKLHERREKISIDLFDEIVCNPTHSLHSLLPQRKSCKYALRRKSDFTLPLCKTERLKKRVFFSHVYKM